jgi:dethiobiotin synthetase
MVPLNAHQDVADLAQKLDIPVIVVVGIRLGCINQARMTFA